MKFTLKLLLIVVLFCGTAMADGDMGGGGGDAPTICEPAQTEGDMGGGGGDAPICEPEQTEGDMGGGGGLAQTAGTPETRTAKISDAVLIYASKFVISFLR